MAVEPGFNHSVCTVTFNEDNSDELWLREEFCVFIAAKFEWMAQSNMDTMIRPDVPVAINIRMTLTRHSIDADHPHSPQSYNLEDTAFWPKTYRLQLEKRSDGFPVIGRMAHGSNHPVYRYRLLWDPSPFPPLDEWKEKMAATVGKFWKLKDFYQDQIKEIQLTYNAPE